MHHESSHRPSHAGVLSFSIHEDDHIGHTKHPCQNQHRPSNLSVLTPENPLIAFLPSLSGNPTLHHHQNSQYISRSPQQASHSLTSTWATTANNPWRDTQTHQSCQKKKWQNHTTNWRLLLFPLSLSTIFFPVSLMTHSFWTHSPCILIVMTRYFLEWMMMMSYGREWKIVMSCWSYKC